MTLQELQEQALKLAIEERWQLIWVVLRSLQPHPQSPPKQKGLAASLIGIAKTDAPPPTDEEVKAMLDERRFQPDAFFSEEQKRLLVLMELWRDRRDRGESLPSEQQAELDALVEAELKTAGDRTAAFGRTAAIMQQVN